MKDECTATCGAQKAKCNLLTHQCEACDPSSDPNCTQTTGDCQTQCSQNIYGICDPASGQCQNCDPSKTPGCILVGSLSPPPPMDGRELS